MLEQVAAALEQKDYKTATKLLKHLLKETPDDPWVKLYVGKIQEATGKHQEAEKIYRKLLRNTTNSKILTQARQGLQKLQEIAEEQRKRAIFQATSTTNDTEPGALILEAISNELKTEAAQKLAKIMEIEPYNARILLPSRGWRLYKTGAIGELKFYGEQLQQNGIPCFWSTLTAIAQIQVFQIKYFEEVGSQITIVCMNQSEQLGSLTFARSEVKARVKGLLPIFEEVVHLNNRLQINRKTETQDYAQFCDLHVPDRRCILRLHDSNYQFKKGIEFASDKDANTLRSNWNNLTYWLDEQLPEVKIWSDFTPFAETILDQNEMLSHIKAHTYLFRREASNWDPAFQLYSGLVFAKIGELGMAN
jgi:tetratricopeptide (TPR) repeat protein